MKLHTQESLENWLDEHLESPLDGQGKYWFPLTLPTYGKEEIAAAVATMCDYRTSMGTLTRMFERQFAAYVGAHDAVMVNSGSSADLLLAFQLINPNHPRLQPGDEVLVPAVTWPTQVWSPLMAGLQVKLVDVDPSTLNVDLDDLRRRITPRTKCLFAVHLMGNPCEMDELLQVCQEYGLLLIEDCCESLGARYGDRHVGTFGLGGSFSFFFSHHMTTMEGGMVTCQSEEDADAIRVLRAHGWTRGINNQASVSSLGQGLDERFRFINWGFNVRPTELQAAFGIEQLKKLDAMSMRRTELAERFYQFVDSSPYLRRFDTPAAGTASPFALVVRLCGDAATERSALLASLDRAGVETRPIVTGNFARQPAAKLLGEINPADYPGAEAVHEDGFYVGLSPMFDDLIVERLIRTLEQSLNETVTKPRLRRAS
ncbi:MAG: DegT/DnrJ/EryC1/StrS family aminotransferase [Planctomycetales bacterium]|nr:DegT/DnrJ/EryC1/StrS family aminotransferase [Planctomycetales bacterium]